jgi:hypothetical protein
LKKYISAHWNYLPEKKIFTQTRGMVAFNSVGFELEDCMKGLKKPEVIQLMGEPNLDKGSEIYYFHREQCHDYADLRKCFHYTVVQFTEEGYYKRMFL